MRPRRESADRATAYHEAGHVVVEWLLGSMPKMVSIEAGDDSHGRAHVGLAVDHAQLEYGQRSNELLGTVIKRIKIALAGEIVQRKFAPRSVRRHHADQDRKSAVSFALSACGSAEAAGALIRFCAIETQGMVDNSALARVAIEAVAAALVAERTLRRKRLRAVLDRRTLMQTIRGRITLTKARQPRGKKEVEV